MDNINTRTETETSTAPTRVSALAGGVGGAKLAAGLQAILPPGALSVVVNTADDFNLWGLHISPDVDTVAYTLAGIANPQTGWGIEGDTWNALEMLARYARDPWFRVGDRDLVTHVLRTQLLSEGKTLTEATADLASALGVPTLILPMCDEQVQTMVETAEGTLDFQEYFVKHRHGDAVTGVEFRGVEAARPTARVEEALTRARYVILCPSNPIVSIGPILAVPGMAGLLQRTRAVKVAVSPIVGGAALKGPAADMLNTLGHEVSAAGVAALYREVVDGMVIDRVDEALAPRIEAMGLAVEVSNTVMSAPEDRAALAATALDFCARLGSGRQATTRP